jgi:hypothetical protein
MERATNVIGGLAIASVTAVLKDLLGTALIGYSGMAGLGDVIVTAIPPDRITAGAEERPQLNLFLYRVAPHAKLARSSPPLSGAGSSPRETPLALELSYLLTAYGAEDFHAEILLGCGMQLFHETPLLQPARIRAALGTQQSKKSKTTLSPVRAALAESHLADQLEEIKITPQFLTSEDMSKLWSALQARYRPSMSYQVSAVVLRGGGKAEAAHV